VERTERVASPRGSVSSERERGNVGLVRKSAATSISIGKGARSRNMGSGGKLSQGKEFLDK